MSLNINTYQEENKKLEVCRKVLMSQLDYIDMDDEDGVVSKIHRSNYIETQQKTLNKHISDFQNACRSG